MDSTQTSRSIHHNINNNIHNNHNNNHQNSSLSNVIVCEGWLTKSPPEKLWKTRKGFVSQGFNSGQQIVCENWSLVRIDCIALHGFVVKVGQKWGRRWFVLRLSGHIPGQYVLEYYADATKKKIKGTIDLDQCEQVDAGLQLESRKDNFQHMFDVRTSKRTFYLVANSESEMNRWVECICSVCGLKIHVEEGQDDRYSPQPSQEFAFSASNNNNNVSSNNTNTSTGVSFTATSTAITCAPTSSTTVSTNTLTKSNKNSVNVNNMKNNSKTNTENTSNTRISVTHIEGPSGPYIPISECHTGKPINGSLTDLDAVPQLPYKLSRTVSDDCYDIPRQLNPQMDSNDNIRGNDLLDCVPKAPKSATNNHSKEVRNSDSTVYNAPRVNWSTYPRDSPEALAFNANDGTRTSVRSCNASVDVTARHCSVNDSGFETHRSSSPLSSDFNRDSIQSSDSSAHFQPPPRPPKPPSLRKSKNKSESSGSLPNVSQLYDVPITAVEQNFTKPEDENSLKHKSSESPKSPDDLYDFPRMNVRSDAATALQPNGSPDREVPLINATVPIAFDRSSMKSSKKHSYTNAPAGYFTNKESVFIYEYKPTLTSGAVEDNSNAFATTADSHQDRSPVTPNSASYSNSIISSSLPNSLVVGPPAVHRELKPRRKGSDSDSATLPSPTMKAPPMQLQPPPALTRIHSAPTKRSFRKPRTPGHSQVTINGTPPRIPSRVLQNNHNREPSTSEDDVSLNGNGSRRNSANDEVKGTVVPPPRRPFEGSEIQYLDLDLESDTNSQSPRTPNEHNHQRSGSTLSNKELSLNASQSQAANPSGSTVYKTVDFVKTSAFNKMRVNQESYRNSKDK
ncbi:unnamed protein product [Medioppia subpectinata]|uniref:PH domain-containing protein n=1 Tax=Medioppia subpectinata TaxID=1979941 RepID=A0A7R9KRA8_9ACAR|nr:unnamed protein product [Medioppia subpectinata]CAG2108089.1 unnamed protein product [Medioppia subpectinata]